VYDPEAPSITFTIEKHWMTSKAFWRFVVRTVVAAAVLAANGQGPARAADKPKVAYLGSEGSNVESDLQETFDEAVSKGLRDTQSVQPVTVARPPRTEDGRPCIDQLCAAAAASQSGAQLVFKAELSETVEQGSPSYRVKLLAARAFPYQVVASHDFEVRNSIPEELAVRTEPQVAVLLKKMVLFLEDERARPLAVLGSPASGDHPAPLSRSRWQRWPWLVVGAAGAAAVARGGQLILRDGRGTCAASVAATDCGVRYDTALQGWIATGVGLGALTAGLWGFLGLSGKRAAIQEIGAAPGAVFVRGVF
jgi:hypothetical protein